MTAPTTGRTVRGEATRAAIVDGTVALIVREGLGSVSHRKVAEESGVALAATTYYFTSKDALLEAALAAVIGAEARRVESEIGALLAEGLTGRADTARGIAGVLGGILSDRAEERIAIFELLLGFARRPHLRPVAEHWLAVYEGLARDVLSALGIADAEDRARTLIASVHGLMLRQLFAPAANPAEDLFEPALVALLEPMLVP